MGVAYIVVLERPVEGTRAKPQQFDQPDELASDLEEIEQLLEAAAKQNVRFHLSLDI